MFGNREEGAVAKRRTGLGGGEISATKNRARAEKLAYNCLSRREYSLGELQDKLRQKGFDATIVEPVLQQLQDLGLQSDARFTESFVRSRLGRGQGPVRIRQELSMRGIDPELTDQYLESDDDYWRQRAFELLSRRHETKFTRRQGLSSPSASDTDNNRQNDPNSEQAASEQAGINASDRYLIRQKQQASHARFLASRGFSPGDISHALKRLFDGL